MSRSFNKRSTAADVVKDLDIAGKTFFITGANSGLGYETAKAIAGAGGHVVMGCRNMKTAEDARQKILQEKADAKIDIIQLDCSSLASVKTCAEKYQQSGWPLHCLVLNAGVVNPDPRMTADGFEGTFQINHLSQFYLTQLLTPLLKATSPSRVVVVASDAHKSCFATASKLTPEYLSPATPTSMLSAYNLSKMLNMLFALEYNSRHVDEGITAYSLHPGIIRTNIVRNSGFLKILFRAIPFMLSTIEQGAATQTYLATAPDSEVVEHAGKYFVVCKPKNVKASARSKESAEKLWQISEKMITDFERKPSEVEKQPENKEEPPADTAHVGGAETEGDKQK